MTTAMMIRGYRAHVAELDARIAQLTALRDSMKDLARRCHGDARPDCPILADLEG
jgi:MerR family copper efflux transcriptional regulator